MTKTFAIVRFQFEGLHHWPKPTNSETYLAHPHRHTFHVEVKIEQFHNERDIEYIELKRKLTSMYHGDDLDIQDLGSKSCESIAHEILDCVQEHQNNRDEERNVRDIEVSVFEDNENGALVIFKFE